MYALAPTEGRSLVGAAMILFSFFVVLVAVGLVVGMVALLEIGRRIGLRRKPQA